MATAEGRPSPDGLPGRDQRRQRRGVSPRSIREPEIARRATARRYALPEPSAPAPAEKLSTCTRCDGELVLDAKVRAGRAVRGHTPTRRRSSFTTSRFPTTTSDGTRRWTMSRRPGTRRQPEWLSQLRSQPVHRIGSSPRRDPPHQSQSGPTTTQRLFFWVTDLLRAAAFGSSDPDVFAPPFLAKRNNSMSISRLIDLANSLPRNGGT